MTLGINDLKVNILVIDDDPSAFNLIHHMLLTMNRPHITVESVDSYESGLEALKENKYDIYIVDYRLGEKDGVNLIRNANEIGIDVPIIFFTAYSTYDTDLEAMRLGAMDYLDKKHLTPELLERSIRYALERKRNERELKHLHERVSALEQLKTDMIRLAAHDIKNPLAAILLNIHTLEDVVDSLDDNRLGNIKRLIDNITSAANKIKIITSNILSLERIQELYQSSLYDIEFTSVVAAIYDDFQEQAQAKSQILTTDEPIHVRGNSNLLSQAISNLVDNAVKYTPQGGHIIIHLTKHGHDAILEVEDNGSGIPEECQDKIFQPFFRIDDTVSGSGLGLYLVRSIVLRLNGDVIFRSIPGAGSIFGFRIPLVLNPQPT